ncbi:hypothetical protein NQ318_007747, partial [Aromia moschata]
MQEGMSGSLWVQKGWTELLHYLHELHRKMCQYSGYIYVAWDIFLLENIHEKEETQIVFKPTTIVETEVEEDYKKKLIPICDIYHRHCTTWPIIDNTKKNTLNTTFTCEEVIIYNTAIVHVAWLKVDTQTILTIHNHVITKNSRIGVSHSESNIWYLHIKEVRVSDQGWYMCQINTDPMKSQLGYLNVV